MCHFKKFIPFSKLSRRKQRDFYVRLRTRIARKAHKYGKNFIADVVMKDDSRPAIANQSLICYFLGLDGHTIWNATIHTAANDYWGAIDEIAYDETAALLATDTNRKPFNIKELFIPIYDEHGRKRHYVMRPETPESVLSGATRHDFQKACAKRLIAEDTGTTAPVFESFKIDPDYRFGIGLSAIVDADEINEKSVEAMIEKFRAIGEKDWQSETPVPHARLPKCTFEEALHAGYAELAKRGTTAA